jgi:CRISPR-associated protein Csh2
METNEKLNTNNEFKNRCYGLVIIKSENSKFNADFTGYPRRLPDDKGTIYATDKALKYCIRRYWVDNDKNVFVWRSHLNNGNLRTRDERMENMRNELSNDNDLKSLIDIEKWVKEKKENKNNININDNEINDIKSKFSNSYICKYVEDLKLSVDKRKNDTEKRKAYDEKVQEIRNVITAIIFSKCIDTKLFGVTYTGEGPLSLTGPMQISYGINRYSDNTVYVNDILSPYPTGDEGTIQGSVGKEVKTLLSYYVYDFSFNPQNIVTHYETNEAIKKLMTITTEDINLLKEALKCSVTHLDTASKIGSENALLLFITLNENSKICLPAMKNFVEIKDDTSNSSKKIFDLEKVINELNSKKNDIEQIELYYNKNNYNVSLGNFDFNGKITIDENL